MCIEGLQKVLGALLAGGVALAASFTVAASTPIVAASTPIVAASTSIVAASTSIDRSPVPDLGMLDASAARLMSEWQVPGLSLAIAHRGDVVAIRGYGVTTQGSSTRVDGNTLFSIGSVTKSFTATAIAMLVDEGSLTFDDRVAQYSPDLPFPAPLLQKLTIRHLLSHSSGFDHHDLMWHAFGYERDELLRRLGRLAPFANPGERYRYQNLMYVVAGQIVERASGVTWERFVAQRIFAPLGMAGSGTSFAEWTRAGNRADGHALDRGGQVLVTPLRNVDAIAPAGAIYSSAIDMAKWLQLQLRRDDRSGISIVSPGAIATMHAPEIVLGPDDDFIADLLLCGDEPLAYGMGWFVHDCDGRTVVEHPGGTDGMSAIVTLIPDAESGAVVLTNMTMPTGAHFALRGAILDLLLRRHGRDWGAEMHGRFQALRAKLAAGTQAPGSPSPPRSTPAIDPRMFLGAYTHAAYGTLFLRADARELTLTFGTGGTTARLIPLAPASYLVLWQSPLFPPERARILFDEDGSVARLLLTTQGAEILFERDSEGAHP